MRPDPLARMEGRTARVTRMRPRTLVSNWAATSRSVNSSKAPFNDVKVRQALSMLIDREFVAEQIWGQTMQPGYSFMPPGVGNYGEPAYMSYKDQSPIDREEAAKKLLTEAGVGPGKPLKVEIRYNTTDNNRNSVIAIAEQWKQADIQIVAGRPVTPTSPAVR